MSWRLPLLEVLGHPLGVVLRRVGVDPAPHTGMTEAAQLRAGPLVLARLHDVEPHADLAPGHGVLLDAELRHEEAVDHVLRLEIDPHRLADGDVHLVEERLVVVRAELPVRPGIRDLPVELLGGDLDHDVGGRHRHLDLRPGGNAQEREHHEDQRGDHRPDDLERRVPVRVTRAATRPVAIDDHERQQRDGDEDEGDAGDRVDQMEQPVDVLAVTGYVFRQPPVEHGAYFFISKLTLVVWPALTSTSLVCLPRVSCHTSTVCLPGGTFSILATPLASVTAAGPGVTATQPSIQLWTSQVSFTYSGFSSFSVITFLNLGWALLIEGLAVEYVWMLCRMSCEFLSSMTASFC